MSALIARIVLLGVIIPLNIGLVFSRRRS